MLYSSRNARQRASSNAVFPEPTGLPHQPPSPCSSPQLVKTRPTLQFQW